MQPASRLALSGRGRRTRPGDRAFLRMLHANVKDRRHPCSGVSSRQLRCWRCCSPDNRGARLLRAGNQTTCLRSSSRPGSHWAALPTTTSACWLPWAAVEAAMVMTNYGLLVEARCIRCCANCTAIHATWVQCNATEPLNMIPLSHQQVVCVDAAQLCCCMAQKQTTCMQERE